MNQNDICLIIGILTMVTAFWWFSESGLCKKCRNSISDTDLSDQDSDISSEESD